MKKILMLGAFPNPIHGQSLVNQVTFDSLKDRGYVVSKVDFKSDENQIRLDQGKFKLYKLKLLLKYRFLYKVFSSDYVYITPGQSYYGALKFTPYMLLAKLLGKKLIFHSHGNILPNLYHDHTGFKKKIYSKIMNLFDKGIALSPSLKQNFEGFIPLENIEILYNFVQEADRKSFLKGVDKKNYDEMKLLYLSNLSEEKGTLDFIGALEILQKQSYAPKVEMVGKIANNEKEILNRIEALPNVAYLGEKTGEDKREAFLRNNTFILPTKHPTEGQPVSILEAMSSGNMIVVTDQGGIPDICKEENAIFIEKNNPQDIADKLKQLGTNPAIIKQKGIFNFQEAQEKYQESRYIDELIEILEN